MPSSPAIAQAYDAYRASMARREQAAVDATLRAYRQALAAAEARIDRLTIDLERLPQSEWRRYAIAERESVAREMRSLIAEAAQASSQAIDAQRAAAAGEAVLTTSQAVASTLAEAGRDVLVGQLGGTVNREALRAIMAQVYATSPITEMLASYSQIGAQAAADRLVTAVATGENPRKIAGAIRRELQTESWRALRIARTEVIRAHTAGAIATMRATPTITPAYEWAAQTSRACLACLAMHGKVISTDQTPARHPNCRCVMLPVIIDPTTGEALSQPRESGQDVIDRMDPAEAVSRFGRRRAELLQAPDANRVPLADMLKVRSSDKWGDTVGITPLRDLVAS